MYTPEQRQKNKEIVEKEMAGLTQQHRVDAELECHSIWANDAEALQIISDRKAIAAKEATPEEVEEIFKHVRV